MKRFALRLGIDRAVFFTLLGRGWNVGAGLLTIAVIARFLSPELQGYYYTFNSVIALQIFAELGLNFAIVQFASHEMAELAWQPDATVSGNPNAKRRLQSLLHFAYSWFGGAALLMIALLMPAGLYFFGAVKGGVITLPNIAIPWSLLVVLTAFNLFITASAALLEGCGKVAKIAVMRLWQSILAMTTVCITLALGGKLYALVASSLMMALIGFGWLLVNHRKFFKDLIGHRTALPGMSWRTEIWPFQWRIAISWMSGYLIFQLFNPLLFKTHGSIAAGQMGMSLQIIGAMNGVAMVWITTKAPTYGQLIASKQFAKLNALFARGLLQSSGFANHEFDAIINFVGVGNPAQAIAMGNSIFDITLRFDEMVLDYLQTHPNCRYLFLSSGAAYGSSFNEPVNRDAPAIVAINNLVPQDWYGVAKLHAECRHRSYPELPIIDIRVFNYFSRTQDISARFLITDILRAIRDPR